MRVMSPRVVPVELFPGDWCIICVDPNHSARDVCGMLEMHHLKDGQVVVAPCKCENSVTLGEAGKYLVRVTQLQKE